MTSAAPAFAGSRALVTGGAGFIGSTLAIAAEMAAKWTWGRAARHIAARLDEIG